MLAGRGLLALGASPSAGFTARGTITLPSGEWGTIRVEAWGADHCRATVDLEPAGSGRHWEALLNGSRASARGPQALSRLEMLLTPDAGCALLPQALTWADLSVGTVAAAAGGNPGELVVARKARPAHAVTMALDGGSGLPSSARWQARGHALRVEYSSYGAGAGGAFAAAVLVNVDGAVCFTVHLDQVAPRPGFSDADFPALAPPKNAVARRGGER